MIIATLSEFGKTAYAIWEFAGGVLGFMLVAVIIIMAISFINSLIR